jgi:hypothetical protein
VTFRRFLDCSYVLLVEAFQAAHPGLLASITAADEHLGPEPVKASPVSNVQAMDMLTARLSSVQGAPRQPRRVH